MTAITQTQTDKMSSEKSTWAKLDDLQSHWFPVSGSLTGCTSAGDVATV